MVKHIVMWKFLDAALGQTKEQNMHKVKSMLDELSSRLPVIIKMEVGINLNKSDAAFDMALYSEFNTFEDLEKYQKYPDHVKISEFVKQVRCDRVVADYII